MNSDAGRPPLKLPGTRPLSWCHGIAGRSGLRIHSPFAYRQPEGAALTLKRALRTLQEGVMAGKFVLRSSGDQFYFLLKAGNGEIIATSERYSSKGAAESGIESVRVNAPDASIEDETGELVEAI